RALRLHARAGGVAEGGQCGGVFEDRAEKTWKAKESSRVVSGDSAGSERAYEFHDGGGEFERGSRGDRAAVAALKRRGRGRETRAQRELGYWEDKVALITGGSKGLGLVIARALVNDGASVVITARNQEQ